MGSGADAQGRQLSPTTAADQVDRIAALERRIAELEEREHSLHRLIDSMRDLAGIDAIDEVLHSIVVRARRLLLADVAYFLTFDEFTGISTMHVSDGILSAAFARLEVSPGEGISGLIAESKHPSWTADYTSDPRYRHTSTIDSATLEEGLHAILGVPVIHHDRVVGLLLAADRHVHDFRPQDAELLYSLAQHAAVLIHNAATHQREQQTVEQLEASVAVLRESQSSTRRILEVQDRLFALLMTSASLQELADTAQSAVGGTVLLSDEHGTQLAVSGTRTDDNDVAAPFDQDAPTAWPLRAAASTVGQLYHLPAAQPSSRARGELAAEGAEVDQILVRVASVAALMVSTLQAQLRTSRDRAQALIRELIESPDSDRAAVLRSAAQVNVSELRTVLVAIPADVSALPALLRAGQVCAEQQRGIAAQLDGEVVLWLPGDDASALAQHCAHELAERGGTLVTVGAERSDGSLRAAADRARATARALVALGRAGEGADSSATSPFPAILLHTPPEEIRRHIRTSLGALLDYDQHHNTDLVATLDAVYACAANASSAAERLFVHVNTVHQRLQRIDQLTGSSWRDPEVSVQRQLALRLLRLQQAR